MTGAAPALEAQRRRGRVAVAMAAVAGCVDAVGYLVLSHVFTAHMSGNSVGFGAALGSGDWTEAFRRGFPIPLFVIGVATGGTIIEVGARRGLRRTMSLVLVIEVSLLLAFMIGGRPVLRHGTVPSGDGTTFDGLVALLTLAMGMQTATLQRVGGRTVRTTYVTGMLTSLAEESVAFAFWLRDERRQRERRRRRRDWARHIRAQPPFNRAALLAAVWCAYITGAIVGGALELQSSTWALAPAILVIALVIALDQHRPIHGRADLDAAMGA